MKNNNFRDRNNFNKSEEEGPRVNEQIQGVDEVRVVGDTLNEPKIMPVGQALALAREMELDLVEIAPQAVPPVPIPATTITSLSPTASLISLAVCS